MDWTTSYLPEQRIVIIETQGIADDAGSVEMAKSILKTMQEHSALLCLIDHSAIKAVLGGTVPIYYRPRELREAGIPSNIRIAEVVHPIHKSHFSFFETVCQNFCINLRVFNDRESAIRWLTQ